MEVFVALVIHLKKDQQIVLNGAVIENTTGRSISLAVKNEAKILRSSDILAPEDAATPASRAYYALQCVYLFPERAHHYLPIFNALVESYAEAAPSAREVVSEIREELAASRTYAALKLAQRLITHEGKVLSDAERTLGQELCRTTGAGEPTGDGSVGADQAGAEAEGQQGRR
ncbi:MAG: flagellar biosynthesis repressor FlbT [Rhodospirillales bacterium]|jgi:flagellar protein FlbT|nr:flagellar biosynthesis repressor FlbT [Rhodospirillales bacterium]